MTIDLNAYDLLAHAQKYLNEGQFAKALARYDIALEHEPQNPDLLNAAGGCYTGLKNHVKAEYYFRQAIKHSSGSPHPIYLTNLGCCLMHQGKSADAQSNFVGALRIDPGNALYSAYLAGCEAALSHKNSAKTHLRDAYDAALRKKYSSEHPTMKLISRIAQEYDLEKFFPRNS